jgi:hypothetical protein
MRSHDWVPHKRDHEGMSHGISQGVDWVCEYLLVIRSHWTFLKCDWSSLHDNVTVFYCTKKCILQDHPHFVPETDLCEICHRVFRQQKLMKCANCACVFCEYCCEIEMDFTIPVTVEGRTRYETGNYCTFKCMRIHHPGFFICLGPVCEYCHEQ